MQVSLYHRRPEWSAWDRASPTGLARRSMSFPDSALAAERRGLAGSSHRLHAPQREQQLVVAAPPARMIERIGVTVELCAKLGNWVSAERALPISHGVRVDVMAGHHESASPSHTRPVRADQ